MKNVTYFTTRFCLGTIFALASFLGFAGSARAATVSFSTTPPSAGPSGISQLTGHITGDTQTKMKQTNVGGGTDDNMLYIDNGRPCQGQTFTTGTNANGYLLTAVSLKQVSYDTYALVPDMTYHIRITRPSGSILTVLAEETGFAAEDLTDCSTCNFLNNGCCTFTAGSGRYITFTFANPVALNANTTYGFDVGAVSVGDHYWETDGRSCTPPAHGPGCNPVDLYTNGTAYSSGVFANGFGNGLGDTNITYRTGDRVFVVALTAASGVIPPSITIQPQSVALYTGNTAQFTAKATGGAPLAYQWQKNGLNLNNGGNISGALTDSLTISNIGAGDAGSYALVVTNSANSVTSAPAALTVVATPAAGTYAYAVLTNNASIYWRLDDVGNPATNASAYDYAGGLVGTYEIGSQNSFNGIAGPRPTAFPGFASANNAVQTTGLGDFTTPTWVTIPPLNLTTNTVTITGWIYPNGDQVDYAGLLLAGTFVSPVAGLGYGGLDANTAGELIYHWNGDSTSTFKSGLVIPPNEWSFVALVVEPTKATLYLGTNGVLNAAVNAIPHQIEAWSVTGHIGHQPFYYNADQRVFNGSIDEVAVFQSALSFDQINSLYGIARGTTQTVAPTITHQPVSQALYAGRTARFEAGAVGTSPLVYQWRKDNTSISDGGNISGASTGTLTIANVAGANEGAYTVVVTNSAGAVTSAPASLTVVAAPESGTYAYSLLSRNPVAYWRLDESGDPATNAPAYDYAGGLLGVYEVGASNGFYGIAGPRPATFGGFGLANNAVQTTGRGDGVTPTWVTIPPLNLYTDTVTMTAWVYPNGPQADYAGLFVCGNNGNAGFAYGGDFSSNAGQLIYWWGGATYSFVSGLVIPSNQWSFVAVVVEPTSATLYLGSGGSVSTATDSVSHLTETFAESGQIGHQQGRGPDDRVFDGSIDEVAVFNYAFTPQQVVELYNAAFTSVPPDVTITIQQVGSNLQLTWPQGTLLEAPGVSGPYTTNNAASPYTFAPTGAAKFFKVQVR